MKNPTFLTILVSSFNESYLLLRASSNSYSGSGAFALLPL